MVFTNGAVSLTKDLVFGLCVLAEGDGWVPFRLLNEQDKQLVRDLLDHNPTCPEEWSAAIYIEEMSVPVSVINPGPTPGSNRW